MNSACPDDGDTAVEAIGILKISALTATKTRPIEGRVVSERAGS